RDVPLLTAGILLLNALLIARLPPAQHDLHEPTAPEAPSASPSAVPPAAQVSPAALRNRGFVLLGLVNGVLGTNQVLLNVVVPLWLVERTDAPHTLLAWLFGTNTVLAVLLQVPAARGSETVPGALRAIRLCAASFVLSCLLIMVTHDTVGWVSIALIWLGHVTITGAELFQSAASWGFLAELSDPRRRGEYQGVWSLGFQVETIVGPALFTYLAINWGTPGWLLIGGIAVVAAAVAHPAARSAQRYLQSGAESADVVPRMAP
ncbi:MAG: MFS transporter, partial [Actinomycetota bacterium]|nr:MFS transporter [Actinomycetota bacterium]